MILRMREGVTISPLDATLGGTFHIARLPEDRFIKISDGLLQLLQLLDGKRDLPTVARAYAVQTRRAVDENDVRQICETVLIPNGLAVAADGSTPSRIQERAGRHRYIRWSIRLLAAPWVQMTVPRLAWLFNARLASLLLTANAIGTLAGCTPSGSSPACCSRSGSSLHHRCCGSRSSSTVS